MEIVSLLLNYVFLGAIAFLWGFYFGFGKALKIKGKRGKEGKIQNWEALKRALETNQRTTFEIGGVSFIVDVSLLDVNPEGNNKYFATVCVHLLKTKTKEYNTNELDAAAEEVIKYVENFL